MLSLQACTRPDRTPLLPQTLLRRVILATFAVHTQLVTKRMDLCNELAVLPRLCVQPVCKLASPDTRDPRTQRRLVSVGDQPYSQLLFVTALSSTIDAVGSACSAQNTCAASLSPVGCTQRRFNPHLSTRYSSSLEKAASWQTLIQICPRAPNRCDTDDLVLVLTPA